mgnify:CR=1 FL=1
MEENNNSGIVSFILTHIWKLIAFIFGGIVGVLGGIFVPRFKKHVDEKRRYKEWKASQETPADAKNKPNKDESPKQGNKK